MKRQQVGDLSNPAPLQPLASPTDQYYRPRIAQPVMKELLDFGPLSNQLAKLTAEDMAAQGDANVVNGEAAWAQLSPEDQKAYHAETAATRDGFAKLIREGKIPEAASPLFQRGFAQASARTVVGDYYRNVNARLAETAVMQDANGLPVQAKTAEAIMAEEWQKVSKNVALQNHYAQAVVAELKPKADESFLNQSGEERAKAITATHKTMLASEVGQQVIKDWAADTEDMTSLSDLIQSRTYENNVQEPRLVAYAGIELAIKHLNNTAGPEEALKVLDRVQNAVVGGTKLGKDAVVGVQIEDLKASLVRQSHEEDDRANRERPRRRAEAMDAATNLYMPRLLDAFKNHQPLEQVRDELDKELQAEPQLAEFYGNIKEDLFQKVIALNSNERSNPTVVGRILYLSEHGRSEEASAAYEAGYASGDIVGGDVLTLHNQLQTGANVTAFMQNDASYNQTVGIIERAGSVSDLAPEVQASRGQMLSGMLERYSAERLVLVKKTMGQVDQAAQLQEFDTHARAAMSDRLEKVAEQSRAARAQLMDKVTSANFRKQGAADLIEASFNRGDITSAEKNKLLDQNYKASDRSSIMEGMGARQARANLERLVTAAGAKGDVDTIQLGNEIDRRFRSKLHEKLDSLLPNADPSQIDRLSDEAVSQAYDEVSSLVGSSSQNYIREGLAAGKSVKDVLSGVESHDTKDAELEADHGQPLKLLEVHADPLIDEKVYKAYTKLITLRDTEKNNQSGDSLSTGFLSWWNMSPREKAVDQVGQAARKIVENPKLNDAAKAQALAKAYGMVGLTPDALLSGELVVQRSDAVRQRALADLEDVKKINAYWGWKNGKGSAGLTEDELQKEFLWQVPVKIDKVDFNPYTTPIWRHPDEMMQFFRDRPDDFKAILKRLKIDDNPVAIQDFITRQTATLLRTGG